MSKILIRISHPAHVNFFRPIISSLEEKNHEVVLSYLERDPIKKLIIDIFPNLERHKAGNYKFKFNTLELIVKFNILTFVESILLMVRVNPVVCVSVGAGPLNLLCRFFGKSNIVFNDDPEKKINMFFAGISSTVAYFPPIIKQTYRIRTFNSPKEWIYLSPSVFEPDILVLKDLGLKPQEYIVLREVSLTSHSYSSQKKRLLSTLNSKIFGHLKVFLSLEDKSDRIFYPSDWIIIEKVIDFHSLMYYSALVISSGDSVPREGAQLGITSIYCGSRKMRVNDMLIEKGLLHHLSISATNRFVTDYFDGNPTLINQNEYRNALYSEWSNLQEFAIEKIENLTSGAPSASNRINQKEYGR